MKPAISDSPSSPVAARTQKLLEAPIVPTLLRLAAPNVAVMAAHALVLHALLIAGAMGVLFTAGALWGGPALYRAMGGTGEALAAALAYSNIVFAGAISFGL